MTRFRTITRPGAGTTLVNSLFGDAISATPPGKYRHPWFTTPAWSPSAGRWVATVNPGFINHQAPVYRATVAEQQAVGNPVGNNPLTGQPLFSASVFPPALSTTNNPLSTSVVDLPLYLNPAIALDFRGIGFDGDPSSALPQFFVNLGAAKSSASVPLASNTDATGTVALPSPPPNLRLLRACDLWIHQPRLALTSEVTLEPGFATGQSNVTQTLGVRSPAATDTLRMLQGTFTPFTPFTADVDPLSSDYEEPAFDELLISTVYLLSPPNTPMGSVPDATWQTYVRHNLFWNLHWAQPEFRPLAGDPGTPLLPPLAGGAAQLVINFLTASLNDATQQALNILEGHSLAGSFWTPGGGSGSQSAAVLSAQSLVLSGPDRAKNAAAKLAAAQQQRRQTQLDLDFPYVARPFPTSFLVAV